MSTRRQFIRTSALAAGALTLNPFLNLAAEEKRKLDKFGFISGVAQKDLETDWIGTLKKAVEFGFTEIEAGSNYAKSPKEFLKVCTDLGITPFASGADLLSIQKEPNRFFDEFNELNYKYLIV